MSYLVVSVPEKKGIEGRVKRGLDPKKKGTEKEKGKEDFSDIT